MQRTLVALSLLGLLGQVQQSRAQGPKAEKIQAKVVIENDSAKQASTQTDSSFIELSPVGIPVTYTAGAFSTAPRYPRLQTPFLTAMGTGDLSDHTKEQLQHFIEKYYAANNRHLQNIKSKSDSYFSVMNRVFDKFGVPADLKYLAVIESGLNTHARSYAGAVGTWQLMASTARLLGLTVNAHQDDRKNLYKSTVAAAKYLSQLHAMFGNWMLVIAAYNCGPGRVEKAIASNGGRADFWSLKQYLPQESQKHVMKFLATTYIMERFAHFFGVSDTEVKLGIAQEHSFAPIDQPLASIALSGKYSLAVIAKHIAMDLMQLEQLNPGLLEKMSKDFSKTHYLYLPADKMIVFKSNQNQILNESIALMAQDDQQQALASNKQQ